MSQNLTPDGDYIKRLDSIIRTMLNLVSQATTAIDTEINTPRGTQPSAQVIQDQVAAIGAQVAAIAAHVDEIDAKADNLARMMGAVQAQVINISQGTGSAPH